MNLFNLRCLTAAIYLHIIGVAANYWIEQRPQPVQPKPGRAYWYNYEEART